MEHVIGKIFKNFREEKGMSVNMTAKGIVTPSYLSKIEHGQNEVTFHKMLLLLNRINVTLHEFMHEYSKFSDNNEIEISHKLQEAHTNKDSSSLLTIKNKLHEEWVQTQNEKIYNQFIVCKSFLADLNYDTFTLKDVSYVQNYLFKAEQWTKYEYVFFSNTLINLPPATIIGLAKNLILKSNTNIPDDTKDVVSALLINIAINGVYRMDFDLVNIVLPSAKYYSFNSTNHLHRLIYIYVEGLSDIYHHNLTDGNEKVMKSIETMRFVGENNFADAYANYYETFKSAF